VIRIGVTKIELKIGSVDLICRNDLANVRIGSASAPFFLQRQLTGQSR
jgi:hypothetical protein